jgi:TPR repeat protein
LTDKGDAAAQFNLGQHYEYGAGVPKDLTKAADLYQKAADQGNADAQFRLGWLYENGQGVATNFAKAEELYQKAADQGNQAAIAQLKRNPFRH